MAHKETIHKVIEDLRLARIKIDTVHDLLRAEYCQSDDMLYNATEEIGNAIFNLKETLEGANGYKAFYEGKD